MLWKSAPRTPSDISPPDTPIQDKNKCLHGIWKAYDSSISDELDTSTLSSKDVSPVEQDLLACLDECSQPRTMHSHCQPVVPNEVDISALNSIHAFPCKDTYRALPSHPSKWPQGPLMIRPSPHTSTKVRGIRRAGSLDYEHFAGFCAGCILPINSGCEAPGESLVIDFESTHFVGTLLLRIKQAKCVHDRQQQPNDKSYFDGKKRKFQAIVKGHFLHPLPMNETVTGQTFDRPAGKLPARWIVNPFVKFISTLAPQLEAKLDGASPRFLTPLVATAQTVLQKPMTKSSMATDLEDEVEEVPSTDPSSLLPLAQEALGSTLDTTTRSVAARMKARKHAYNQLAARHDKTLQFDPSKQYTFEFYQHLLDFGDEGLAIDMGQPIGKVGLSRPLDGQPIKFMSAHKDPATGQLDTLWSFDMWHASLYPYAEKALTG